MGNHIASHFNRVDEYFSDTKDMAIHSTFFINENVRK